MQIGKWVSRVLCVFGIGLLALTGATPGQAEDTYTPGMGGPGGALFDDPCRDGDVLVGFNYTAGKAMNSIGPVCQTVRDGHIVGHDYGLSTWGKVVEVGGVQGSVRCPPDMAVKALRVLWDKYGIVHHVRVECHVLVGNVAAVLLKQTDTAGGEATEEGVTKCPVDAFAIGMTGYYGALVDKLGLKCRVFADNTAPAVVTPPADVKGTNADFAGTWETVIAEVNAHFRVTLRVDGDSVTGEFINEQDPKYNGRLTGVATDGHLKYTYTEPAANASGAGSFIVTTSGTMAGFTHAVGKSKQYEWEGTRISQDTAVVDIGDGGGGGDNGNGDGNQPPQTNQRLATQPTTIYDQPAGNDVAYLNTGDAVTIVSCEDGGQGWCKISTPKKGYVWGGDLN